MRPPFRQAKRHVLSSTPTPPALGSFPPPPPRLQVPHPAHQCCPPPPPPLPPRRSPLKEVIFAIRAIMPLIVALFLLIWLVLRRPLPACSWAVEPRDAGGAGASTAGTDDASVRSGTASMGRQSMGRQSMGRQSMGGNAGGTANNKFSALYRASVAVAAASQLPGDDGTVGDGDSQPGSPEGPGGVDDTAHGAARASTASKGGDSSKALDSDVESCAPGGGGAAAADAQPPAGGWLRRKWSQYCGLLGAIAVCQIGMIMFNIGKPAPVSHPFSRRCVPCNALRARVWGASLPDKPASLAPPPPPPPPLAGLTYGFTALGDQVGGWVGGWVGPGRCGAATSRVPAAPARRCAALCRPRSVLSAAAAPL